MDFIAPDRYQMGTLYEAPGEMVVWNFGSNATVFTLRSISTPLSSDSYVAIRIPCPDCKPTYSKSAILDDGGDLFVYFRGTKGYSSYDLTDEYQDLVYLHLRFPNSRLRNEYLTFTGHGTELLTALRPGYPVNNQELGLSIRFCQLEGELATVSVGPDADSAARACPNYGITTARPDWAYRCKFVLQEQVRVLTGTARLSWKYENFDEADYKCNKEKSCTGIFQEGPGKPFEVRASPYYTTFEREGAKTWACFGFGKNFNMLTEPQTTSKPKPTTSASSKETETTDAAPKETTWTTMEKKHCTQDSFPGTYADLQQAKEECEKLGSDCAGVYDQGCKSAGHFKLCKAGHVFKPSASSCVHAPEFAGAKETTAKQTTSTSQITTTDASETSNNTIRRPCVTNGKGSNMQGKPPPAGTPCTGWYNGQKQQIICYGSKNDNGWCGVEAPPGTKGPYATRSIAMGRCSADCARGGTAVCICDNGVGTVGDACIKHGSNMCTSCSAGFELNEAKTACVRSGTSCCMSCSCLGVRPCFLVCKS